MVTSFKRLLELPGAGVAVGRFPTKGREAPTRPQEGKIEFRIKPHTHQRYSEGSNKPCAHQDPETPQRLTQNSVCVSPEEVRVSSGLLWGQGLWVQQTWLWHKPSWRKSPLTHQRDARTYTGLGKQTLGGHKQNPVHTRTQEKGEVTPIRDLSRLAQECPGVSGRGMGWWWPVAGLGPLSVALHAWDLQKEVAVIFTIFKNRKSGISMVGLR